MHLPIILVLMGSALAVEFRIEVTNAVECTRKTKAGDVISVDYKGTLENGEVFDSSNGRAPFKFSLGKGNVIKGWDQGLLDMCIGEKRKLTIPGNLAYGASRGIGSCKTDCTLLFDTELKAIEGVKDEKAPEPEPEPVKPVDPATLRQMGLDRVILTMAGLLFVVSGAILCMRARKRRSGQNGKGVLGNFDMAEHAALDLDDHQSQFLSKMM